MRALLRLSLLTLAFALGTSALGWWAVPIIGAAWGLPWGVAGRARTAALAAGIAWALLLAWDSLGGRLGALFTVAGGIFPVPGALLALIALLYAALLAGCAAYVAGALQRPGALEREPTA